MAVFGLAVGQALLTLAAIAALGRLVLRPLFRSVARTHSAELFVAACLLEIEAQPLGAHCRRCMSVANARQPGLVKRFWDRPTIVERDAGWRCRRPSPSARGKRSTAVPWQLRRTLAAGMGELNTKRR